MQNAHSKIRIRSQAVPCELCNLGSLCIPIANSKRYVNIVSRKLPTDKGQILVKSGDHFTTLYVVHSGSLKSYMLAPTGCEQITGFYLPGDIIGFEALSAKKYPNYIQALTHSLICELKYQDFEQMIAVNEGVRKLAMNLMSDTILDQQRLILLLSQKNADERVATFIYSLYNRYAKRGHVSLNIKLPMNRNDIANYLGLTIETISRAFSRLQQLEILTVRGKHLLIKDLEQLLKTAGEQA